MTSESSETSTNVFVFERASRGYLTRLNRSPDERDMADFRELRCAESVTRTGDFRRAKATRTGDERKAWASQQLSTRTGGFQPMKPPGQVAPERQQRGREEPPGRVALDH